MMRYSDVMMVRTQIQLTAQQARRLRQRAAAEGQSISALIRKAVEALLTRPDAMEQAERNRRALAVVGRFSSGLGDLAENHDRYLAEAYGDHNVRGQQRVARNPGSR